MFCDNFHAIAQMEIAIVVLSFSHENRFYLITLNGFIRLFETTCKNVEQFLLLCMLICSYKLCKLFWSWLGTIFTICVKAYSLWFPPEKLLLDGKKTGRGVLVINYYRKLATIGFEYCWDLIFTICLSNGMGVLHCFIPRRKTLFRWEKQRCQSGKSILPHIQNGRHLFWFWLTSIFTICV